MNNGIEISVRVANEARAEQSPASEPDSRVGMHLQDVMDQMPDDASVRIGMAGGSSFVFAGTRAEYEKYIDRVSTKAHDATAAKAASRMADVSQMPGETVNYYIAKMCTGPKKDQVHKARELLETYRRAAKKIESALELDKWARNPNLRRRKVTEIYSSVTEKDTTIILLEGVEAGRFWNKDEFNKALKEGKYAKD